MNPSDHVPSIALVLAVLRHPVTSQSNCSCLAAAVVSRGSNALSLADLHTGLGVVRRRGAHALLNLASHGQESLLDVARVLGRGLEEGDAQAVGEFLYSKSITYPWI